MSAEHPDADLPGDADFRPTGDMGEVVIPLPPELGGGGVIAQINLNVVSVAEQAAIHHNQLRYAELQKLRLGQANLYNETSYR